MSISVRLGETWNRTELTANLALAVAGQGDIARAGQLLEAARSLARPSDKFAMATVRFREAGVLRLAGRDREAVDKFREAITQFSHGEWPHWLAVAYLEYAEVVQRMDRPEEAAEALATAETLLGEQSGARAARLAAFRQALAARKG